MKKGNLPLDYIIHFSLIAIFVIGLFALVNAQQNGADMWESYYVGEVVKIIDSGSPGDEIRLDVGKAISIASKNLIEDDRVFSFDFENRNACVRLSNGRQSCLNYFNDVRIIDVDIKPGDVQSVLVFKLVEVREVG